jgi:hypothetical protein
MPIIATGDAFGFNCFQPLGEPLVGVTWFQIAYSSPHLRSTRETFFDELPRAEYLYKASAREILNSVFAQHSVGR